MHSYFYAFQKRISESACFFFDQNTSIGTSNIIPGNLKFDLVAFRNLKNLQVHGISVKNITNTGSIRHSLTQLTWHHTDAAHINEFLLCDCIHKEEDHEGKEWNHLDSINLSGNQIVDIDSSIKLAPNLKTLTLDQNQIKAIGNLVTLPYLQSLSLCENFIEHCVDCHLELGGNLVQLNLSQNRISSLHGFRKMFSLVKLDVSCNLIEAIEEVDYVATLPCLDELVLTGNPIAGSVDYRSRVLARFGDRCNDVYLDNEKGSAHEIDTALVLAALRQSETFSPQLLQKSFSSTCSVGTASTRTADKDNAGEKKENDGVSMLS